MGLIKNKKGFAFSFLALFISILIFAYAQSNLAQGDFKNQGIYKENRITKIDSEIKYFKEIYIKDVISFTSYSAFDAILNYINIPGNYDLINKNISKLNSLFQESLLYGTLDSNVQPLLVNKNIYNFTKIFADNFRDYSKGNFSFNILNVSLYETNPYYVTIQVFAEYNISMDDNLSNWNFKENFEVSIPVIKLSDPEFIINNANNEYKILPADLYATEQNWTLEIFNETLINMYSTIYANSDYKYNLGNSFLRRFTNSTIGAYQNVRGFWSFDYDIDESGVYDSSQYNSLGKHFGNTYLILNFNDETFNDSSVYNHSITTTNVGIAQTGIFLNSSIFSGINNDIEISQSTFSLSSQNQFSISMWINPDSYIDTVSGDNSVLFSYGIDNDEIISLELNSESNVEFDIGNHNGGTYYKFITNKNITLSNWSHLVATFDGITGTGKIFIDGILANRQNDGSFEISSNLTNFISSSSNIYIGNNQLSSQNFEGKIDELVVYSKLLSNEEIAKLYEEKKTVQIDYKNSLHDIGIEFDGKDDYVNISNLDSNIFSQNYSIELWFYPTLESNSTTKQGLLIFKNNIVPKSQLNVEGLRFFLNDFNEFEWDIFGGEIGNLKSSFELNKWNYLTATFDGTTANLYHNSKLVDTRIVNMHYGNLDIAFISFKAADIFFKGIIDEVKIYNRTLSTYEIEENYYNYNSNAKGCCNYLTLINPNLMEYNTSTYNNNISYSSKIFYNYYNSNINHNMTLWNVTNITSNIEDKNYYNFMLDDCALKAFGVYSFKNDSSSVSEFPTKMGEYNNSCSNFIKEGIY